MTREEAIKELELIAKVTVRNARKEAMEMAIEALQDRPTGTWEEKYIEDASIFYKQRYYCSHCGDWNTYGMTDFCPNCGADMRTASKNK